MHALVPLLALQLVADVTVTGMVASRNQVTFPSEASLLPTRDQPVLLSLNELSLIGHGLFLDERLRVGADVAAFVPFGALFAERDAGGQLARVEDHAVALTTPFIALSEYWVSAEPTEHLVLTAGKRRLVWGPGIAFSPTDLLNPLRDPTDPSLQRAGFLHARIDIPFERVAFTALVAPAVLATNHAIPTKLLLDDDDEAHWAGALRAYALVGDADINAWLLWTHRYGDSFEDVPRLALTWAQNILGNQIVHAEVLLQQGTTRAYAAPPCTTSTRALARCVMMGTPPAAPRALEGARMLPRILAGWRIMPDDGSMLSVEYLYQADGLLRAEFDDVMRLLDHAGTLARGAAGAGPGLDPRSVLAGPGNATSGEVPTRFAFAPLRRHYVFVSWTRPQVVDDFTLQATLITPVEDLSALVQGALIWQARDWLQLSLLGFVPVPSPARVSADLEGDPWQALYDGVDAAWRGFVPRGAVVGGVPVGEYDALPFRARVLLEARAWF